MLTEYQQQFYNELGMTIKRHFMENDLTPLEIIGVLDLIKTEVREETLMLFIPIDIELDDGEESEF